MAAFSLHDDPPHFWITALEEVFQKRGDENFGLASRVSLADGEIKHIPMIDFDCPCSEQNLHRVADTLSDLGQKKGFIIESGRSYHYYGIDLFSEEEWRNFMERCQEQDIIEREWPLWQLRDGFSVLRLSTSSTKPYPPQVIVRFGEFPFYGEPDSRLPKFWED